MDYTGIKMNIRRYVFAILALSLLLTGCKKNIQKEDVVKNDSYTLKDSWVSLYANQYGENGLIEYSKEETVSKNEYGQATNYSEMRYYYDNQKNLIRKETYNIYEGKEGLYSIDTYSPTVDKTVTFRNYPKDTMSYQYRKKNESGKVIEEYRKVNMPDIHSEDLSRMQYNDSERLILDISTDMTNNEVIKRTYQYRNAGDTLITSFFKNGVLVRLQKGYKSQSADVEASIDYETQDIDTVFIAKNKTTSVMYSNGIKLIDMEERDDSGNTTKKEHQRWERYKK
jgi:hypothetical protein